MIKGRQASAAGVKAVFSGNLGILPNPVSMFEKAFDVFFKNNHNVLCESILIPNKQSRIFYYNKMPLDVKKLNHPRRLQMLVICGQV